MGLSRRDFTRRFHLLVKMDALTTVEDCENSATKTWLDILADRTARKAMKGVFFRTASLAYSIRASQSTDL